MDDKKKKDIIKQYRDFVPVKLIAREYGVVSPTIYCWLNKWSIKRSGIKYLLGEIARQK